MPPQTRYAKSGDVNIAYQVVGDGPVRPRVRARFRLAPGPAWADPRIARFLEKLASFSRLILFDKRGTGLSDPVAGPAPLEDRHGRRTRRHGRGGLRARGAVRAVRGRTDERPVCHHLSGAHQRPDPLRHLCHRHPRPRRPPGGAALARAVRAMRTTLEHWGEGQTLAVMAPSADSERDRIGRGVFERSAASPQMARTLIEMVTETDVRDLLPSIRVPTLVLHREEEFIPVEGGAYMAERIPGARLVVLPGMDHIPFYGDADGYAEEIEEFLTGARHAPDQTASSRRCCSPTSSTPPSAPRELGDARWHGAGGSPRRAHARRARAPPGTRGQDDGRRLPGHLRRARARDSLRPGDRRRGTSSGHRVARRSAHGRVRAHGDDIGGMAVNIGARIGAIAAPTRWSSRAPSRTSSSARASRSATAGPTTQGRARRMAPVRRGPSRDAGQQPTRAGHARAVLVHKLVGPLAFRS